MERKGLPRMIHAIGHGVGLDIHEFPRLSVKYKDELKGSTFALEPAVYYNSYGARFEETVYYDGKKVRIL
jgi:Xaa-Pro aminopeptidase